MNKNIVTSGIVSVIIVFLGFTVFGGKTETIIEKVVERQVGAVSTIDNVDLPFVSIGGKKQYYYSQSMFATSSAICSIKNPFNATSTLISFSAQVTSNGIASAQTLDLSTSTSAYASSSPAYFKKFATGTGQFSVVWQSATTTSLNVIGIKAGVNGDSDNIIGPTDYLTLKVSSSTPGTYPLYYTGTCSGVIERL